MSRVNSPNRECGPSADGTQDEPKKKTIKGTSEGQQAKTRGQRNGSGARSKQRRAMKSRHLQVKESGWGRHAEKVESPAVNHITYSRQLGHQAGSPALLEGVQAHEPSYGCGGEMLEKDR